RRSSDLGASPWTPWPWRAFWRCRSCSAPTSCWCSTAALGGEWRGGGQARAAPAAASWADSRAGWASPPGRAAGGGGGGPGLSTGPCSVVGCGAPVLPVVGLVFAGLSSGTLALLSGLSRVLSLVV